MATNEQPTQEQLKVYNILHTRPDAIQALANSNRGQGWLRDIGVVVGQYRTLNGHQYPIFDDVQDWTRYLRYGMTWAEHMQHDIDVWVETYQTAGDLTKRRIIERIFSVLRWNDFRWKVDAGGGFADPQDYGQRFKWSLAASLSHGARVCFIIPKATHDGFRDWLTCSSMGRSYPGSTNVITHRWFGKSSHDAEPVLTAAGRVDVHEEKIGGLSHVTGGYHGYGMNLAMGVNGGPSPVAGRNLSDDGSCGHLFFFESNVSNLGSMFDPKRYKIMMIGIEASGSGSGDDLFGSSHGTGQEQRGTGVSLYWRSNVQGGNPVGMQNLPHTHTGTNDIPPKYGGMVVHLVHSLWNIQQMAGNATFASMAAHVPSDNPLDHPEIGANGANSDVEEGFSLI